MAWVKYDSNGAPMVGISMNGIQAVGVSNVGNTLGMTGLTPGKDVVLAGSNFITLSQSTGAATNTIWIQEDLGETLSRYMVNSAAFYQSSTSQMTQSSMSMIHMPLDENVTFSRIDVPISVSMATSAATNTAAVAISAVGVLYSQSGSTLNPIAGQSSTTTYSWASNSGVYSSLTGPRLFSFNIATSLSHGRYFFGVQFQTTSASSVGANTTALNASFIPVYGTMYTSTNFRDMSALTASTINDLFPLRGVNTVQITNTTMTVQQSNIIQSGTAYLRANIPIVLRNV